MPVVTPPSVRMGSYGSISQVDGADAKPDLEQQQEQKAMSLVDRIYAYDLTWSTKLYHRFGRDPTPRLCWEIFSHSGDGFLYVARHSATWHLTARGFSNAKGLIYCYFNVLQLDSHDSAGHGTALGGWPHRAL